MKTKTDLLLLFYFIFLAVATRLMPHPWNVTALGGLSLFLGKELAGNKIAAVGLVLMSLFVCDLFLGFHSTMVFVYLGMAVMVLLGSRAQTGGRAVLASLAGSGAFFVISNFGVWMVDGMYQKSLQGLLECYTMAWPFFRYQWAADIGYFFVIAGLYSVLKKRSGQILNKISFQSR